MVWRKKGLIGATCVLIATAAYSQPEVVYDSDGFEDFIVSESVGSNSNKLRGSWSSYLQPVASPTGWSAPSGVVVDDQGTGTYGKVLKFETGESAKLLLGWQGYGTTGGGLIKDQPQVITIEFDLYTSNVGSFIAKTFRSAAAEPNGQEIEFGSHKLGGPNWEQVFDANLRLETPEADPAPFPLVDNLVANWYSIKITVYHAFPPDAQTLTPGMGSYHSFVVFEIEDFENTVVRNEDVLYSQWGAWAGHLHSITFDAATINSGGKLWLDNLKVSWDEWRLPSNVGFVGAWDPDPAEFDWGNLLFDRNLALLRLNEGDPGLMMLRSVFFYSGVNWQTWTDAINASGAQKELPYDQYQSPFPLPHEAYPGLHFREDYVQCWKATSEVAELLMDSGKIFGFHLGDEPVWNGADVTEIADIATELKNTTYGFPGSTVYWLDSHRVFNHNFLSGSPPGPHDGTWINRTGITSKIGPPFVVGNWKDRAYDDENVIESRSSTGNGTSGWQIPEEIDWVTSYWYQLKPDEFHYLQEYYHEQIYKKLGFANQRVLLTPGNLVGFDPADPGSPGVAGSPKKTPNDPNPLNLTDDQLHTMRQMARHLLWATLGDSSGGTRGGATEPIIGIAPWFWKDRYEYKDGLCAPGCKYHDPNDNPPWGKNHGYFGIEGLEEYRKQFESYGRAIDENYIPFAPPSPPAVPDLIQGFEVFGDGEQLPSIYEWDLNTYPPIAPLTSQIQFKELDGNTIIRMDKSVDDPKFRYCWGTQPRFGWNSWDGHPTQHAQFDVYVPSCYADLDSNGVVDIFDFLEWQDEYVASDPHACDLDTSTGLGVCDTFDLLAFQDLFAAGCDEEETLEFDVTLYRGKNRLGSIVFKRGLSAVNDIQFRYTDDNLNWDWEPLWTMPVRTVTPPMPGATANLHEGWNTVRFEVQIGDFKLNDPDDNAIIVSVDGVEIGWFAFYHLDRMNGKDRDAVFTSLGFELRDAGTGICKDLQEVDQELRLDNIGIWAPDQ